MAANAGLVVETYQLVTTTITVAGREIPTTTVWSGQLSTAPAASSYAMLRPATGDWPLGTLNVVARQSSSAVLADAQLTIGPVVEGTPPSCELVSAPCEIAFASHPGGGGRPPAAGIVVAGVMDPYGPLVSIDVEYVIEGIAHLCHARDIAEARGGRVAVLLQGSPRTVEVKRVRIANVLGNSLELLPPFPWGTAPAGPLGIKF